MSTHQFDLPTVLFGYAYACGWTDIDPCAGDKARHSRGSEGHNVRYLFRSKGQRNEVSAERADAGFEWPNQTTENPHRGDTILRRHPWQQRRLINAPGGLRAGSAI